MFKLDCTEPFGQLGQPCENIELELGWQTQPDGLTTWQPGLLDSVGDVAEPRPGRKALNLLDYIYNKIFSKIVYVRWRNTPEAHQGIHQTWRCIFFRDDVWQMFGMECATLVCQPWFNKSFWPYWKRPAFYCTAGTRCAWVVLRSFLDFVLPTNLPLITSQV